VEQKDQKVGKDEDGSEPAIGARDLAAAPSTFLIFPIFLLAFLFFCALHPSIRWNRATSYDVKIAARGPYATLDDAVGADGMGASFPKEMWLAEARAVELHVEPPLPAGAQEAQCQYPYGTAIVCGDIPHNIEQNKEFYMLAAINNKLRHFPQFANAVGIHCVRDCAGARAFSKAYADYARAHPGFDANEPIEMDRIDSPPPPRSVRSPANK